MTIERKFTLAVISALLVVTIATLWVFSFFELREETKKLELFAKMTGQVIEESLDGYMRKRNSGLLDEKLQSIKRNAPVVAGIWMLNSHGIIKNSTDSGTLGQEWRKVYFVSRDRRRVTGFSLRTEISTGGSSL